MEISDSDCPPEYFCPISLQRMQDPVVLCDGFSYEKNVLEQWLKTKTTSPLTGEELKDLNFFPNTILRNLINQWMEKNSALQQQSAIAANVASIPEIDRDEKPNSFGNSPEQEAQSWSCYLCTFENKISSQLCAMCQLDQRCEDVDALPGVFPLAVPNSAPVQSDGTDWNVVTSRMRLLPQGAATASLSRTNEHIRALVNQSIQSFVSSDSRLLGFDISLQGMGLADADFVQLAPLLAVALRERCEKEELTAVNVHAQANRCGDAGARAMLAALSGLVAERRVYVRSLRLFDNHLTDGAAKAVGELISDHVRAIGARGAFLPQQIHLSSNRITATGAAVLLAACVRAYPFADAGAGGAAVPVYLRLENNLGALAALQREEGRVCVLAWAARRDRGCCTVRHCIRQSRRRPPCIHLVSDPSWV